ncbi:hypothetical protein PINS_up008161 [Pythium insidiosum]|nr:hypothetical protein PINS_up008161 [Pythium insidiosum]
MDKTSAELQALGMLTDTPGARRQAFFQWVQTYIRYMKAAADGEYEMLPRQRDGGGAGDTDLRLRAILRKHETQFMVALEKTKEEIPGVGSIKSQNDVRVGDAVEVQVGGSWIATLVEHTKGTDIGCSLVDGEWLGSKRWRYVKAAKGGVSLAEFIKQNRGDELAVFPSYRVFCNIFRRWVDKWEDPLEELLRQCRITTMNVSDHLVEATGAAHRVGQFFKDTSKEVMRDVSNAAHVELMQILNSERRPYTQDGRLFQTIDSMRQDAVKKRIQEYFETEYDGEVTMEALTTAMSTLL